MTSSRGTDEGKPADTAANVRWLFRVARPELGRATVAALIGALAQACAIALAGTAGWLIARAAEQPPVFAVTVAVTSVRALGIGRGVLRYAERLIGHDAALRVLGRTRLRVYLAAERAGPAHTLRMRHGPMLTRLTDDVEAVQDLVVRGAVPGLVLVLGTALAATGLGMVLPAAGAVLLAGTALGAGAAASVTLRRTDRAERRCSAAREETAAPTVELLHGMADLEAHGATDRWLDRIERGDARYVAAQRRLALGLGLADALVLAATGATLLAELLLGIAAVDGGALPGAWLPVIVLVPIATLEPLGTAPRVARELSRGLAAAGRLRRLDELPTPPVGDGVLAVPNPVPELRVERATVRWPSAPRPTLVDVSLTLPPGRRIGIVGESGVGKSTLLSALLGFLPTERGAVRLDGIALPDLATASLRSSVVSCDQEARMFDSTIRNNLLLARPDADDERLLAVLHRVRLADWAAALPHGLDTNVGEHGTGISGGERQRLALARALLADPAVLLLDEPTAYLDEPTAAALMRDLLVVTAGRSTVLVTHRLAGLSVVDEILVLGRGGSADGASTGADGEGAATVVQRGAPEELMQEPGPYRAMWFRSASAASASARSPARVPPRG